jgi:tyrosyl-tRNA synthetase
MKLTELLERTAEKLIPQKLADTQLQSGKKLRIYWGIDPTGKIHLGHAVSLRILQAFVDEGHHVILVIGSFTAMIGDPTGKDATRTPLTRAQVEDNFLTYKEQASKVLDISKVEVRYNHEWLEKLRFEDIIGLASHFTVQQMMERDMFEKRWNDENPISVHEFLYPLMVGYDSVTLDVDCEMGGTDQEFNMLAGRHLQQAMGKREKFVLTTRLLEGTDGRKMSKSYNNCIFLTDEPVDMYGKVMSLKDDLITTLFQYCTDVPMEEIKEIEKAMNGSTALTTGKGTNPKEFKMRLAREIVTLYHGEEAAKHAEGQFTAVFTDGGAPEDMPEVKVKKGALLLDVLAEHTLIASKSEGRRLIEQGGIKVNDAVVTSVDAPAEKGIVKVGKRKFVRIVS